MHYLMNSSKGVFAVYDDDTLLFVDLDGEKQVNVKTEHSDNLIGVLTSLCQKVNKEKFWNNVPLMAKMTYLQVRMFANMKSKEEEHELMDLEKDLTQHA